MHSIENSSYSKLPLYFYILYTYPLFFKSLRLHIAPKQQMSLPQVTTHLSIIAYQSERIGHHSNRRVH